MFAKQNKGHINTDSLNSNNHSEKLSDNEIKRQISHLKRMGKGAEVEITDVFQPYLSANKRLPVGSVGFVDGHTFGKDKPIVNFGERGSFSVDADKLKVLKGSSDFSEARRNKEIIKTSGSKEQIIEKLRQGYIYGWIGYVDDDGWFNGTMYLDNGEGISGDAQYRGQVKNGEVIIEMNKKDVPRYWQSTYDTIKEDVVYRIEGLLD